MTNGSFCHPAAVLGALSRARRDKSTDAVSRNAAIAIDVGDVTLVSQTIIPVILVANKVYRVAHLARAF